MNQPPLPGDWPTDWQLAGQLDQLTSDDVVDVKVGGTILQIRNTETGLIASSDVRAYPIIVVDDEVYVLLGDASH